MAYNKADDPLNPNANGAGMTKPVGTLYGLHDKLIKDSKGEKGQRVERASGTVGPSSDDDGGDEVHHSPPPPSTLLEGEENGEQTSGHPDEMAMHLEPPQPKLRAMLPTWMPYDRKSNKGGR
ncbi:hypothetical protein PAXINDRAFT_15549 [Paxillus involutus ATCC 200175]|uniref:Uncharacterized protein n=1 Tax=Paxillus involutus ATCC 200175 TaxID=664439 RepID=A0A0C9TLM4_PAXIN|nr:hypothetical protein PAXINDRAFT_15549 [Paxillus involutus ATCC 200175]